MRIESDRRARNDGWVHRLRENDDPQPRRFVRRIALVTNPTTNIDFAELTARYSRAVGDAELSRFAESLGVSPDSLRQLRVGFDGDAWTLPMTDPSGRIVGIRRRFPNGRKAAVKGGHEGLFIPVDLPTEERFFITEGPTDCAALLSLGFAAIGRPSCRGAVNMLCRVCRGRDTVIVSDADEPGREGAGSLAQSLRLHCPAVRIIQPPHGIKDAREWVRRGTTAADILCAVEASEPLTLSITRIVQ